jgi:hypothetical protein
LPIAPNGLDRLFAASEPDKVRAGNIPHIATDEGWRLSQTCSAARSWVGSMQVKMAPDWVMAPSQMAGYRRHPGASGLIFHSDRGNQ